MNENSLQKCRTCLKSTTKIFPLTKLVTECNLSKTYGELLNEHVTLKATPDYEHLMPQYLCILCCRMLRNTHVFIMKAQYCNNKLINVISKQLHYLQENPIDLPGKVDNDTSFEFKLKEDSDDQISDNKEDGCYNNVKENLILPKENRSPEPANLTDYVSEDLPLESSTTLNKTNHDLTNTKDSWKSQTETVCPICGKSMEGYHYFVIHLRTHHDIQDTSKLLHKPNPVYKEEFICNYCSYKCNNKYTYSYHLKHEHGIVSTKQRQKDKIIKCPSCDYTSRTYAALNYHKRSKHGTEKDKFKCKFCAYMCLKKFDLLTHVKNSHKELIKSLKAENKNCEALKDVSTSATSKAADIKLDDLGENGDRLSDDLSLASKIEKLHGNSEIYQEREQFSDEEFIRNILNIKKRHSNSSTKSLARRCDECGNVYKNYRALYAHQRHVHISEDKYSLCTHCGKKYKRRADLRIHIEKTHMPKNSTDIKKQPAKVREKRFLCTECSYVCTTITTLKIHINRHHTGEKPYKCDICFKSFIVPYDLKTHRYLHTGERPYKCPICSKGFRDKPHMLKHKRIHSNERPYKCKDCNKSFTQSYNLSVHRRTHLRERKLNCVICGKVFENRSLLNIHRINENHHDEVT